MHSSEYAEKKQRYKSKIVRTWVMLAALWVYVLGYIFELGMRYFG
mgnify:FL=1